MAGSETPVTKEPRLKRRRDALRQAPSEDAQVDFWAPPIQDLVFKDHREMMERPFVSLSTTHPQKTSIEYTSPDGSVWVKVEPHPSHGMATISDWDIIVWAASHIWDAKGKGEPTNRTIRFFPYHLLKSIRRETTGQHHYDKLENALARLNTTTVYTSLRGGGTTERAGFHFVDDWKIVQDDATGEILCWEITLNRWIYEGILDRKNVLTIDRDYFLLKSGSLRWLYRVARKHAGTQPAGFAVSLKELHNKSGSPRRYDRWASDMRGQLQGLVLLGYAFALYSDNGREFVHMIQIEQLRQMATDMPGELEIRLAPSRRERFQSRMSVERAGFWKAEMDKAERRRAKRALILSLYRHLTDKPSSTDNSTCIETVELFEFESGLSRVTLLEGKTDNVDKADHWP